MTIFIDQDDIAYLVHSSNWNKTLNISRLTEDYLKTDGFFISVLADQEREAPALFRTKDMYYMITSGCTASTQYAYAEMLRLSTEGRINFVEDTREYATRAEKMKRIFTDNGFHIVYDHDVTQRVGDGFFFTIGYGSMSGGELLKELLYYGVSSISLSTTGSEQQGVRACTSRMRDDLYDVMQERMQAFAADHPLE